MDLFCIFFNSVSLQFYKMREIDNSHNPSTLLIRFLSALGYFKYILRNKKALLAAHTTAVMPSLTNR